MTQPPTARKDNPRPPAIFSRRRPSGVRGASHPRAAADRWTEDVELSQFVLQYAARVYDSTGCASVTSGPVSTELDTDTVQFESLPTLPLPLHCPRCGRTHSWQPRDAWVSHLAGNTRH